NNRGGKLGRWAEQLIGGGLYRTVLTVLGCRGYLHVNDSRVCTGRPKESKHTRWQTGVGSRSTSTECLSPNWEVSGGDCFTVASVNLRPSNWCLGVSETAASRGSRTCTNEGPRARASYLFQSSLHRRVTARQIGRPREERSRSCAVLHRWSRSPQCRVGGTMVTPMDRATPRKHHQDFKYAIISRALHRPKELIASCTVEGLTTTWNAIGAALPSEECMPPEGLGVKILGNAEAPIFMIMLPPPERPNEAHYLCIVPAGSWVEGQQLFPPRGPAGTSCFRVFGMERSMLLDGGLTRFVVGLTASRPRNYGAPGEPSPGAFWEAVANLDPATPPPLPPT